MIFNIRQCTVICLIIISGYMVLAQGASNSSGPITYVSYVDEYYGFYKVRDVTTNKPSPYEGRTLTINQGDIVKWKNDGTASMTLVSDQNLWPKENGKLNKEVSYKFDVPGKYTFYVQLGVYMRQTVIVNPVGGYQSSPKVTVTGTSIQTPAQTYTPDISGKTPIKDSDITNVNDNTNNVKNTNDIKIHKTGIVGILVSIISLYITYKVGRDG